MENTLVPFFVIGILLLIFLLTGIIIFRSFQTLKQQGIAIQKRRETSANRAKQGIWAGATIVTERAYIASHERHEKVRIDLRLQVQPPEGEKYQTRTTWLVNLGVLPQLQPGQTVSIIIDRDVPERIYPNMQGAELWGWDLTK